MGEPVTRPGRAAVHPLTGEYIDLAGAPTDELASWRDGLGEYKRLIDAALGDVDAEIGERLDRENIRSARIGDWQISIPSPFETVWDVHMLGLVLESLVAQERITRRAAEEALVPVTEYKARAVPLKKLLGHSDPEVREAIDLCRTEEPRRRRYVTVRRAEPQPRISAAE